MVGILFLYFIGRYFYRLALDFDKQKWLYAILGIISYYVGVFIGGIPFAIFYELDGKRSIENIDDLTLGLILMPFGIGASIGAYKILKRSWEKNSQTNIDPMP